MRSPRSISSSRKSGTGAVAGAAGGAISILLVEQEHRSIGGEDPIVADHERRTVGIAKMPPDCVRRVVAIAADAADAEGAGDNLWRHPRGRDLQVVHTDGKTEARGRSGIGLATREV